VIYCNRLLLAHRAIEALGNPLSAPVSFLLPLKFAPPPHHSEYLGLCFVEAVHSTVFELSSRPTLGIVVPPPVH